MIEDNSYLIESLVKIGNHPDFMKMVEPNIMKPLILQEWMVKRTLEAQELLNKWVGGIGDSVGVGEPSQSVKLVPKG